VKDFEAVVGRMDAAVAAYLARKGKIPQQVKPGMSPGYSQGAIIMGVYALAGKDAPKTVAAPVLSPKGQALWEKIRTLGVSQYTGRGAYTGFVDNKNTEGDTDPVGPRSTARFRAPARMLIRIRAGCPRPRARCGRSASAPASTRTCPGA